jgi:hypothetical protein
LTHLGAREYEPVTGRFISFDPLMDLTDPQQWHADGRLDERSHRADQPAMTISLCPPVGGQLDLVWAIRLAGSVTASPAKVSMARIIIDTYITGRDGCLAY